MSEPDCVALHARVDMLRSEVREGLRLASVKGPEWFGFEDQIAIATRCEKMAEEVEGRIEEEC